MSAVEATGWVFVAIPVAMFVYAYAGYPVLLRLLPRRLELRKEESGPSPFVSIVIPAYNEAHQIRETIEALIAQQYPADRRQILILSDASTDGTDDIVGEYAPQGVELLRMPGRSGKTAAENASVPLLRGEIIINSDASVRLHPMAIRHLVAAMADARIGVASTVDVSITSAERAANAAEAGYVGYEMKIRALETRTGGIVGASGSGYAIRASLHRMPVRADLSRDFSAALTAERHGYRAVSVADAICYVPRTSSLKTEYRRKVRTVARGMETLLHNRDLMGPRHGLFAWKLFSHKVCRWLVPPSAVLGLAGVTMLATIFAAAQVALGLAILILALAAVGGLLARQRSLPRPIAFVTFAIAGNLAVLHALFRVIHGHEDHVWEPTRRSDPAAK
jgi:cellulose synthase/poly-beta-1,6-N-acetylglucosamine synthase-like glycosyltransferase